MDRQNLQVRLQEMVADALQVPASDVPETLAFGEIPQWDSMGHMTVIMVLEERFGLDIDAGMIASLTSIPAMCDYLQDKVNGS